MTCWATFVICSALPVFVVCFFCLGYKKIKDGTMSSRVNTLYEGLALNKTTRITAGLYPLFFMVKRYLFCLVVIFMDDHPAMQIISLDLLTMLDLAYLSAYMPYESKLLNWVEMLNEFAMMWLIAFMFGCKGEFFDPD